MSEKEKEFILKFIVTIFFISFLIALPCQILEGTVFKSYSMMHEIVGALFMFNASIILPSGYMFIILVCIFGLPRSKKKKKAETFSLKNCDYNLMKKEIEYELSKKKYTKYIDEPIKTKKSNIFIYYKKKYYRGYKIFVVTNTKNYNENLENLVIEKLGCLQHEIMNYKELSVEIAYLHFLEEKKNIPNILNGYYYDDLYVARVYAYFIFDEMKVYIPKVIEDEDVFFVKEVKKIVKDIIV